MTLDESRVVVAQSCVRRLLGRRRAERAVALAARRVALGRALLEQETEFGKQLALLNHHYRRPLAAADSPLSAAAAAVIFTNLDQLAVVSDSVRRLLAEAAPKVAKSSSKKKKKQAASSAYHVREVFDVMPALERMAESDCNLVIRDTQRIVHRDLTLALF